MPQNLDKTSSVLFVIEQLFRALDIPFFWDVNADGKLILVLDVSACKIKKPHSTQIGIIKET